MLYFAVAENFRLLLFLYFKKADTMNESLMQLLVINILYGDM